MNKSKTKSRTKFVIFAIINITLYTAVVLFFSYHEKTVPSELTVAFFSAWTVELGLLAGIKIKDKGDD